MVNIRILMCVTLLAGGTAWGAAYVSPDGRDGNSGTVDQPFQTIGFACNAVRGKPDATVVLLGGDYLIEKTLTLESGMTLQVKQGEVVRLLAARSIKAAAFAKTDLPGGHVLMLYLKTFEMRHLGPWKDEFHGGNGDIIELLYKGKRMPLARWPNDGPTTMKRVLDTGGAGAGGDAGPGGGKHGGTFEYRDERAVHWPVDQGVWLRGYWRVPWELETVRVAALDPQKHTITLAAPVPGGIGSKFKRPEGSGKEPYWVINALSELDQPGEWCLDFKTGRLYFWPPAPLADGDVMLCDMETPVIALKDASHVTIRGLTLEGGLGNAIEITKGRGNSVSGCEIRGFGEFGVVVKGGTDHAVTDCHIHDMGAGGIILDGGDRLTLTPAKHSAINNHIHDFGQVQVVYAGGIRLPPGSVGMHVAHNLIHDTPHVGIQYDGNDHVLEYNEIHNICLVSEDMGGFYAYHDWSSYGNIVRFNYVHDSPLAHGVYCDDGDSGDTIYGNVFYKLDAGVFIGGGHDNIVTNNIAIECKRALHIDARGTTRGYNLDNKGMVNTVTSVRPDQPPWSTRYPSIGKILMFHPELPTGTVFDKNLAVRCVKDIDRSKKTEELQYTTFGTNVDLPDANGFTKPGELNASLFQKILGFEPIPWAQIGLVHK